MIATIRPRFSFRSLRFVSLAVAVCLLLFAGQAACAGRPSVATSRDTLDAGDHSFTLHVGEYDRHYTVHVPRERNDTRALAVVVMLHGGGGTSRAAAHETGWTAKADREGFLAVFPDALARDPARPSNFARNPQLWNDGSDRFYDGQQRVDDIAFLARMLDDLAVRFQIDERHIFFTGFSNGASMTFLAGARLAPRIAAIAPVAGACWNAVPTLTPPVPACYLTGTADPLNLIEGGVPKLRDGNFDPVRAKSKPPVRDSVLSWAKANSCSLEPRVTTDTNGVHIENYGPGRAGAEVVYVAIDGLGHMWAGGKSLLPEAMVGPLSNKLSATDFIWDFFRKHGRTTTSTQSP